MAIPVDARDVERVLQPWLGSMLLTATPIVGQVTGVLKEFAPYRQTLYNLRDQVEHDILVGISKVTRGSMCVVLDDYSSRRLFLKDITYMTDDVMGLVFDSLTPFSANFTRLNDYALHEESLSVLRVLYQKYEKFFTVEEYAFLIAMIKKIYPQQRYIEWLKEPGIPPTMHKW